jgi:Cu2+-exporting ATPase
VALIKNASTEKLLLALLADCIAGPFVVLVLLAGAAAFGYWWQIDHTKALSVAVALLTVTCPCALSLATPAARLSSAGALARRGILARCLQAFEALAGINAVVFDRTGTLTQDRLAVSSVPFAQAVLKPRRWHWLPSWQRARCTRCRAALCWRLRNEAQAVRCPS